MWEWYGNEVGISGVNTYKLTFHVRPKWW